MNAEQINQAARMWNSGFDSYSIARVIFGKPTAANEAKVYTLLWRAIIPTAISIRRPAS